MVQLERDFHDWQTTNLTIEMNENVCKGIIGRRRVCVYVCVYCCSSPCLFSSLFFPSIVGADSFAREMAEQAMKEK
jgi:hypothetical protein